MFYYGTTVTVPSYRPPPAEVDVVPLLKESTVLLVPYLPTEMGHQVLVCHPGPSVSSPGHAAAAAAASVT